MIGNISPYSIVGNFRVGEPSRTETIKPLKKKKRKTTKKRKTKAKKKK